MSMNFGREQALLRQRLSAVATPERAAAVTAELGTATQVLGAEPTAVADAARDLAAQFPTMGRAQMTAFVRTLWQSKTHELRATGVELLVLREALLEAHDLPILETLLKDCDADPLAQRLARDVLGPLVTRNKKLWKDLQRFAGNTAGARLQRAAVRAAVAPVLAEPELFDRFAKFAMPLCKSDDAPLQRAIDELLTAMAAAAPDGVTAFAEKHQRTLKLPKKKATKAAPAASKPSAAEAEVAADVTPAPKKKAAKKAQKKTAKKATK